MVMQADVQGMFKLASAFGPDGIKFALDASEAAVKVATEAARAKLKTCLKSKWPRSKVANNIRTDVKASRKGIVGTVTVTHDWIEVLMLGKNVPAHSFPSRGAQGPYVMKVGKKGKPKTYKSGPNAGSGPPVFISGAMNHPGYKGVDCATPTEKQGERILVQKITRVATRLAQKLARSNR